jgi:tetratricopeptide (TPR) repeat protein
MDKAEESARRLIQLSPNKAQSYLPLAAILEVRKDRAGAEAELVKGVALEPANPRMGVLLAEFQLRSREVDKALATFDAVLAYAPTDAQALTGKGMSMQIKGNKDEAAKLYLQAVQARNDYVPALNNLAMLWADGEEDAPAGREPGHGRLHPRQLRPLGHRHPGLRPDPQRPLRRGPEGPGARPDPGSGQPRHPLPSGPGPLGTGTQGRGPSVELTCTLWRDDTSTL